MVHLPGRVLLKLIASAKVSLEINFCEAEEGKTIRLSRRDLTFNPVYSPNALSFLQSSFMLFDPGPTDVCC